MTFELGDKVQTVGGLYISGAWREGGLKGKVVDTSRREVGLITVKFKGIEDTRFIRPEYLELRKKAEAVADGPTEPADDEEEGEAIPDLFEVADNPEVQEALALILERIEEIKALLTAGPKQEIYLSFNEASFVTEDEAPAEEEPAPEPVFKKAKEVNVGDSLYTEAGVWDKVNRAVTKSSGYTSLYGTFGNKIAQVPSGRVVQVLEPVS